MTPALDEVSTEYGLLAEAVSYPDDRSSVTYRLRANARWHDGKPVTPDDVIFSFDVFKKNSPQLAAYYRHVTKAEKTGEREVTFTFDRPGNRELPQIVGQLPVLPKHWWEGTDKNGNKRDVTQTTLEPPLGCGPYRLKDFAPGRTVVYEKVEDYWGKDLNVNVGTNNFDADPLRIFPRLDGRARGLQGRSGRLAHREQRQELGDRLRLPGGARQARGARGISDPQSRRHAGFRLQHPARQVQGPARAARLQLRVRFRGDEQADLLRPVQAHRQLFRGHRARRRPACRRARSSKSSRRCDDKVPPELFTTPYTNPVGGNPQTVRDNLREALALLREAGYEIKNTKLVNAKTGEPFTVEFLVERAGLRARRCCSTSPRSSGSASP